MRKKWKIYENFDDNKIHGFHVYSDMEMLHKKPGKIPLLGNFIKTTGKIYHPIVIYTVSSQFDVCDRLHTVISVYSLLV